MRILCILVLTGCGRIAFDPLSDGGSSMVTDGRPIDVFVPLDGPFPSGLVAWYPMDDMASNTADVVGGVNGLCTPPACPTPTTGHHGGAFLFDASDDCIEIPDLGQLDLPQLTIAIWARQDVSDNCSAIAKRVDVAATPYDTWQIQTTTTNQVTGTSTTNAQNNGNVTTNGLVLGQFQHLAMYFNGVGVQMFINGVSVGGSSGAAVTLRYDNHSAWIGCDDNGGTFALHWNGALDDLQIYNRVLTTTEIAALAAL